MRNIIFKVPLAGVLCILLLFSCQSSKPEEKIDPGQRRIISETQNNIVYTRITNRQGELLEIIFNNNRNDAIVMFNGQEIALRGEETASGIKYTNNQYVFTQWKDDIEFKKDGIILFKY